MSWKKCRLMVVLVVILSILKEIVCENDAMVKTLPASKKQLSYLAEDVCWEFFDVENFQKDVKIDKCIRRFSRPSTTLISQPSNLTVNCRSSNVAMYSITPSKDWQLVVLVPENETLFMNFNILKVNKENGTIVLPSNGSTFWTTVLNKDGTPTVWHRGPKVPPWNGPSDNYTVKIDGLRIEYNQSLTIKAIFKIKFEGEVSLCSPDVEVYNFCESRTLGDEDKKLISPKSNQTLTYYLEKDDNCTLKMYSKSKVIFKHQYRTSLPFKTKEELFAPERIQNLSLEAVSSGETWNIHVHWSPPAHEPFAYNLTLYTPDTKPRMSPVIDGNLTDYTFEDVPGEEMAMFDVVITAYFKTGNSTNIASQLFPPRPNYQAMINTGTWSLILILAAAAIGAVVWCRRKKNLLKRIYSPTDHPTIPKECLVEACLETGVEDSWEVRSERLLLHEVIGEGAFGVVRKGTLAPTGREVAVKMLKEFSTVEEMRSFRTEMELMKSVGAHPHVVSLIGCCSGLRPLIVAEYCSRGDLLNYLRCSWDVMVSKRNAKYYNNNLEGDYRNDLFKKPLKEQSKLSQLVVNKLYDLQGVCDSELTPLDLLSFCRQIAMGMEFLASNRMVHRDLAARNILVTADRTLKIADFGLSRDVYQENQYKQKGNGKMPIKWMALESLTHRIYTTQSDVWSFGVVVWEVVTVGAAPYPGVPPARLPRLLRAGYRMPRPNNCSKSLYELMLSCWRARPRDRPTFASLHHALDELLNCACADEYLSLELDDDAPPTPKAQRYIKMFLRGNRVWSRGEVYERPLKGLHTHTNHYSSPPAAVPKTQPI